MATQPDSYRYIAPDSPEALPRGNPAPIFGSSPLEAAPVESGRVESVPVDPPAPVDSPLTAEEAAQFTPAEVATNSPAILRQRLEVAPYVSTDFNGRPIGHDTAPAPRAMGPGSIEPLAPDPDPCPDPNCGGDTFESKECSNGCESGVFHLEGDVWTCSECNGRLLSSVWACSDCAGSWDANGEAISRQQVSPRSTPRCWINTRSGAACTTPAGSTVGPLGLHWFQVRPGAYAVLSAGFERRSAPR